MVKRVPIPKDGPTVTCKECGIFTNKSMQLFNCTFKDGTKTIMCMSCYDDMIAVLEAPYV